MSGYGWKAQAQQIIDQDLWPADVTEVDRQAVIELAKAKTPYEPYFTLKGVITSIIDGSYQPSRFNETKKKDNVHDE